MATQSDLASVRPHLRDRLHHGEGPSQLCDHFWRLQLLHVPPLGRDGVCGCGLYRSLRRGWRLHHLLYCCHTKDHQEEQGLKLVALIAVCLTGALLLYGTTDMPNWGDPNSPASLHVSPRYIEKTMEETAVPNMVTSVLADYRGYDTLGETTVIFTAAIACILLIRRFSP